MTFSLAKLSYYACNETDRKFYYKLGNILKIDIKACCEKLIKYIRRVPEGGGDLVPSLCAAMHGHLDCLKFAHDLRFPWDENTCTFAASYGHLDCLKYVHENGCSWDSNVCIYATINNQLSCLKYAHENNCPWDHTIHSMAAFLGYLDCLNYAHSNGCPWTEMTCEMAASNGQLECLIFAHVNGCPWTEKTCTPAASNGRMFDVCAYQWMSNDHKRAFGCLGQCTFRMPKVCSPKRV